MRGRRNICGINLLQYLKVLQYVGKLHAESLQIILINTQSGKEGDVPYLFST